MGIAIYGYLVLKTRVADRVIGAKAAGARRRFRIS